ncbi:MAG: hypothetical protein U1E34_06045 [Amaricoccus sp.]
MRRLFLIAAVISSVAAAASAEEITSADQCDAAVAANPASAREAAAVWYRLGGGTAARLCEASALEAMGADTTAAQLLTGVAQNTNRAMPLDLRATVLEDAGRLWLRAGRPDLTLETLASANRLTAADPDRLMLQARAEAAGGDWTATEATLRAFLAAKPDDPLGLALHAAALRQLGEIDAARGEAARALACDPGLAEAQFESAAALAEAGDRDGAGRLWLLLIEQHPDSSLAGLARRNLQGLNAADIATSQ